MAKDVARAKMELPMDRLWNVKQVAYFLNISEKCVYNYVHAGDLPFKRIGTRYLFVPSKIKEFVGFES